MVNGQVGAMIKQYLPAIRIGLCIAALTITVILIADQVFHIVPDQQQQLAESRKLLCESIAVQFSSLVEQDKLAIAHPTRSGLVQRKQDLLSLGLRLEDGKLLASTQGHSSHWDSINTEQSTLDQVRVPIYKQNQPWGTVEVKFIPPEKALFSIVKNSPLTKLVLVTLTFGLLVYSYFIRRTLRIMDPGSVVPERVKTALDQLVEGVVLLDDHMTIVLANNAFLSMTGQKLDKLVGKPLTNLNWRTNSTQVKMKSELPWEQLRSSGGKVQNVRLLLQSDSGHNLILSCNVAAISDGDGKQRGLIASFDDISDIERTNSKLRKTISRLEEAEKKIRSQNSDLRKIASIDPLTGIMNRGAFFDKLNTEFMLARQEKLQLSCIMADIDHFKKINDTYGHGVGDDVIKGMASVLGSYCNANGAVGRYGGEEFCVVLPGVDINGAMEIAETIRQAFADWSQQQTGATRGQLITASLGVSAIDLGATNASDMVNQADKALYESKTAGRNRVSRWYAESNISAVG